MARRKLFPEWRPKVGEVWRLRWTGDVLVTEVPDPPDKDGALLVWCKRCQTGSPIGLSLSHWMPKHPSFPNGRPATRVS